MSSDYHGSTGITPPKSQPGYATYRSPYGPKYTVQKNIRGWTFKSAAKLGVNLGAFGGVAGFVALYILSDVPRVRKDILSKVPIIGEHFIKEVPPSDNPF